MPYISKNNFNPQKFPDYNLINLEKEKTITFKDKIYRCKKIYEKECKGFDWFISCLKIVGSFGIYLFSKKGREDWHAVRFGKRVIYIIKEGSEKKIIKVQKMGLDTLVVPYPTRSKKVQIEPAKEETTHVPQTLEDPKASAEDDPFDFSNLPIELQHHVFSFLPTKTIVSMGEVSKRTKESVEEYLEYLEVNMHLLPKLAKSPANAAKYQACLAFILDHANLEQKIVRNKEIGTLFFTHILSTNLPEIFEKLTKKQSKNLLALFLDNASDVQLKDFINQYSHQTISSIGLNKVTYPILTKYFFNLLTEPRINRLLKINEVMPQIMWLLCYDLKAKIETSFVRKFYESNLKDPFWNEEVKSFYQPNHSSGPYGRLMPHVIAIEANNILDEHSKSRSDNLVKLFNLFDSSNSHHARKAAILTVRLLLKSMEKEKFLELVPIVRSKNGDAITCFIMQECDEDIVVPFLKEYIFDNLAHEDGALSLARILNSIKEKGYKEEYRKDKEKHSATSMSALQLMEAFIQGCQKLLDPMQTFHLRFFIAEMGSGFLLQAKEAFLNCNLKYENYKKLKFNKFRITFQDNFFQKLIGIENIEQLRQLMPEKLSSHILQALAAGIRISPTLVLKAKLDDLTLKAVFEEKGIIFEKFNQPIDIDDYLEAQQKSH